MTLLAKAKILYDALENSMCVSYKRSPSMRRNGGRTRMLDLYGGKTVKWGRLLCVCVDRLGRFSARALCLPKRVYREKARFVRPPTTGAYTHTQ